MIVVTKVQQGSPILGNGKAKTVSYDKQSVLEGTQEFHLVTFIMLA